MKSFDFLFFRLRFLFDSFFLSVYSSSSFECRKKVRYDSRSSILKQSMCLRMIFFFSGSEIFCLIPEKSYIIYTPFPWFCLESECRKMWTKMNNERETELQIDVLRIKAKIIFMMFPVAAIFWSLIRWHMRREEKQYDPGHPGILPVIPFGTASWDVRFFPYGTTFIEKCPWIPYIVVCRRLEDAERDVVEITTSDDGFSTRPFFRSSLFKMCAISRTLSFRNL